VAIRSSDPPDDGRRERRTGTDIWADDFARAGDLGSALDARRAADAVRDELSAD
jgi:hypothetical protein